MKALLDTNVFLWSMLDDIRLSPRVREIVRDGNNVLLLSVATVWEVMIKSQAGKLRLPGPPGEFIRECADEFAFINLPIALRHALHLETLPPHHRDPFDRILIAQSQVEDLPILTADSIFSKYGAQVVW